MAHNSIKDARVSKHYNEIEDALSEERVEKVSVDLWQTFDRLPELTPIEQLVFLELYALVERDHALGIKVEVQKQLGKYRVDFLLTGFAPILQDIVVECDGHNYHERTKEQAKRDRSMDREIQAIGYKIFRFTGSEIWKDPAACRESLLNEVEKLRDALWKEHKKGNSHFLDRISPKTAE